MLRALMDDVEALKHPRSAALQALVERGFVEQVSDAAAIDQALQAGPVTFYIGFDPTASSLHVGNLVTIMAMRILQRYGHRPVLQLGLGAQPFQHGGVQTRDWRASAQRGQASHGVDAGGLQLGPLDAGDVGHLA